MKRVIFGFVLASMVFMSSGCASYSVYKGSEKQIMAQKVYASGDEKAIKAFAMGDTVGIGIDVLATESLTHRPWMQLGAAVLDAGILWAASEGVDQLEKSANSKKRDEIVVNVTGDGNQTTIINNSESSK